MIVGTCCEGGGSSLYGVKVVSAGSEAGEAHLVIGGGGGFLYHAGQGRRVGSEAHASGIRCVSAPAHGDCGGCSHLKVGAAQQNGSLGVQHAGEKKAEQ